MDDKAKPKAELVRELRALRKQLAAAQAGDAVEALHGSGARLRSTLDSMLEGCQIIGFDWRYLYVNDAAAEQARLDKANLLGHRMMEVFPGIAETELFGWLRRCMDRREPHHMENEFTHLDGSTGYFELSIQPVPEGVFILSIDVTEHRRAIQALRQSEERYRLLADHADGFVMLNSADGRRLYVSPSYYRRTGWTPEELESGDWRVRVHPDDRARVLQLHSDNLAGKVTRSEYRILCKDGSWLWVDSHCKPILNDEGTVTRLVLWSRDVTAQRDVEAQLWHTQKMESIGTLAGGVAHEINNPINGIMNYAELIKDELEGKGMVAEEFSTEIIHEAERVANLVRNLLQFSRQERQTHSPTPVGEIVGDTLPLIRTLMRHDQIELMVDVPADLPAIACHKQQIQQVVMNLLTNARDALNERYTGYDENKTIRISVREAAGSIRITVEDRGAGIAEEVKEHIFEPFFTTKDRAYGAARHGTGLGLAISHGIVTDHHGRLTVETKLGEWTRFHVDLPVEQE